MANENKIINAIVKQADWNLFCKVQKNNFGFTEEDIVKIILLPITLK